MNPVTRVSNAVRWRYRYLVDEWWLDHRFGVSTAGILHNRFGPLEFDLAAEYQFYEPVVPRDFRRLCRVLPRGVEKTHTFLDFGAGRGRALLLAAEWGFSEVVGIELDRELAAAASINVAAYRRRRPGCAEITVVQADALVYEVPRKPLVVFFYNPFVGEAMDRCVGRILQSQAEVSLSSWILYRTPQAIEALTSRTELVHVLQERGFAVFRTG